MSDAAMAFAELLPARIDRADLKEPTLLLAGKGWWLSVTCDWRWG